MCFGSRNKCVPCVKPFAWPVGRTITPPRFRPMPPGEGDFELVRRRAAPSLFPHDPSTPFRQMIIVRRSRPFPVRSYAIRVLFGMIL